MLSASLGRTLLLAGMASAVTMEGKMAASRCALLTVRR